VSLFFGVGVQFAPVPENCRLPVTIACGIGFVISCIGFAFSRSGKSAKFSPIKATIVEEDERRAFSLILENIGERDAINVRFRGYIWETSLKADLKIIPSSLAEDIHPEAKREFLL